MSEHGQHTLEALREISLPFEALLLLQSRVWRGKGVDVSPQANPVLLLPGFLAGDDSLRVLHRWMRRMGWRTYSSGMVSNIDCSEKTVRALTKRLKTISAKNGGRQVDIIGHSRGGMLARVLLVRNPELVGRIIGLGTPFRAGMNDISPLLVSQINRMLDLSSLGVRGMINKGCKLGAPNEPQRKVGLRACCRRFWKDLHDDSIEAGRITSVYSTRDGIVATDATHDPCSQWIKIDSSHCGMIANRNTYRIIADTLSLPVDE